MKSYILNNPEISSYDIYEFKTFIETSINIPEEENAEEQLMDTFTQQTIKINSV